jgi:asparagine synthase (glutamine-hydrolysing)
MEGDIELDSNAEEICTGVVTLSLHARSEQGSLRQNKPKAQHGTSKGVLKRTVTNPILLPIYPSSSALMSAIAGIVAHHATPSRATGVRHMVDSMAHRGPDGVTVEVAGQVGLGHCAFHTTPESVHETLPLHDARSGCILTADARIDNREELIAALPDALLSPSTSLTSTSSSPNASRSDVITDADLILAAYLRWGTDAPRHLIGDFAFAIWDPSVQRLFCARDHIGIKPFYYFAGPAVFAFGTEIKALLTLSEVPRAVNDERAAEYIARQAISPQSTMYAGILRLPPAHSLTVDASGAATLTRYWTLDADYELRLDSDEEYEEAFRAIFTRAVECRLRSKGPVGVMLSGGLDSSSVACVARELYRKAGLGDLDTFTAQFGYELADESPYLESLRSQGGFRMHEVPMHGESPVQDLDRIVRHVDQPPYVCNAYMLSKTTDVAAAEGVRVLLDGSEGDIAVSYGLGRIGELVLSGRWNDLESELADLAKTTGGSVRRLFVQLAADFLPARIHSSPLQFLTSDLRRAAALHGVRRRRLLWEYGLKPVLPRMLVGFSRSVRGGKRAVRYPLLSRSLAEAARLEQRVDATRSAVSAAEFSERLRHASTFKKDADGIATTQEEGSHIHAMGGGEARHPFYDVRLVQFCASLPSDQKLRMGYTRSILRRALRGVLPESIATRMTKGDLSENFMGVMAADRDGQIAVMFDRDRETLDGYFDASALRAAHDSGDGAAMWTALAFTRWHRMLHESVTSPPAPGFASGVHHHSGSVPEYAMS